MSTFMKYNRRKQPKKLGASNRKTIDDTDTQTSVVTTASSEHTVTDVSSSESVSEKSSADIMSVPLDKPTVTIVSDSDKRVDIQCSYVTWISRHCMSRHTEHRRAATQGDGATTQRSDVSMASTIAMRATAEEWHRTQTIFEPYTGNILCTWRHKVFHTHACLSHTNFVGDIALNNTKLGRLRHLPVQN